LKITTSLRLARSFSSATLEPSKVQVASFAGYQEIMVG